MKIHEAISYIFQLVLLSAFHARCIYLCVSYSETDFGTLKHLINCRHTKLIVPSMKHAWSYCQPMYPTLKLCESRLIASLGYDSFTQCEFKRQSWSNCLAI
jgi:hypothetical protein